MKTEKKTVQPPVPQNDETSLPPFEILKRFVGNGLPSPETIAAYTRPEPPKPEQLFYDINQAAFALNVCAKTVRRLIARGQLTTCKELRKILIPREQIEAFLKATCAKPNFQK